MAKRVWKNDEIVSLFKGMGATLSPDRKQFCRGDKSTPAPRHREVDKKLIAKMKRDLGICGTKPSVR